MKLTAEELLKEVLRLPNISEDADRIVSISSPRTRRLLTTKALSKDPIGQLRDAIGYIRIAQEKAYADLDRALCMLESGSKKFIVEGGVIKFL